MGGDDGHAVRADGIPVRAVRGRARRLPVREHCQPDSTAEEFLAADQWSVASSSTTLKLVTFS